MKPAPLANDPAQNTMAMAQALGITEGEVIRPAQRDGAGYCGQAVRSEAVLLTQLASWGKLTTIVESCGSIFEFKGAHAAVVA